VFIALSVLLLIGCLLPAAAKLAGHPRMRQSARHFRIPWRHYRLIGVAELAAAAGVLAGLRWHPLGVAAAVGMAVLLVGALVAHRRAGDHAKEIALAVITLFIAVGYLITALV
jgi:DoxX-like family